MSRMQAKCPVCGCELLEYGDFYHDGLSFWQTAECTECHMMWNEVYEFSHNEDVVTCATLDF